MTKRVGIVTLYGNFNYGNRLQNYAVQRIYEELGYEATTLIYGGRSLLSACRHAAARLLWSASEADPEAAMGEVRAGSFRAFSHLISSASVDVSLSRLARSYDLFSVGSDQVWNPRGIDSYAWMFLKFAAPEQRVALAPSIGASQVKSPYARLQMASGLRGFGHLSVREGDGARLIKELTGQDAEVVIDPTLMLDAAEWRQVARDSQVPDEPYLFVYVLGQKTEQLRDHIERLSRERGLRVVSLSDKSREGEVDAGPSEFVSLIDHAAHVVTDSYHAAVFSLLMDTPLTIFKRSGGSSQGTFSRLATLADKFGLWGSVMGDERFEKDARVDRRQLEGALARERQAFARHLGRSIPGAPVSVLASGIGCR